MEFQDSGWVAALSSFQNGGPGCRIPIDLLRTGASSGGDYELRPAAIWERPRCHALSCRIINALKDNTTDPYICKQSLSLSLTRSLPLLLSNTVPHTFHTCIIMDSECVYKALLNLYIILIIWTIFHEKNQLRPCLTCPIPTLPTLFCRPSHFHIKGEIPSKRTKSFLWARI